ncbi:MAG: hypothetical protein MRZ79_14510 [Bacteroidia bacterium]|nr:hypothetical protein [Bacteroidia bacterium]
MILPKRNSSEDNWELILSKLQLIRGKGLWRGSAIQLRSSNLLRIPFEGKPVHEASIHIKDELKEVFASFTKDNRLIFLKDFDLNVDNFLMEVLKEVRPQAYIRTNKDKATYRHKD